jgi:hypothetical protein
MDREFRVDISRPIISTTSHHGLRVECKTDMCYVDCYFPDGTQMTHGYIGVNPTPGAVFAPLANCSQAVADLIQAEIDKQLGAVGTVPPVIVQYVGNDADEDDDEERDEDE